MKNRCINYRDTKSQNASSKAKASAIARGSCRKLEGQLRNLKETLVLEHGAALPKNQERLLRSALSEAEALAWQTQYPHLLFPVLAQEKALSVRNWAARQKMVRRASPEVMLAA